MFLDVNGISIYAEESGSGYPVVLIHALGTSLRSWDPLVPLMTRRYRVVRYDYRGHGRSEKSPGPATLPLLAEDLRSLLVGLGLGQAHVVGLAVGGMIAQQLAVDHPGLASGLVLADTASAIGAQAGEYNERRADAVERSGMRAAVDATIHRAFAPGFSERHPERLATFRGEFLANDPHGYACISRALRSFQVTDRLSNVHCPTLLLVGELDRLCPPSETAAIQARILGAKLEILSGVGHFSAVEAPEAFAERTLAFLDGIPTDAAASRRP
jgi:3-oxoadipate enol-lactonase